MISACETSDLLVFSHLRWDFIFKRPQHLLSRHAKNRRVFYFEEAVFGMTDIPRLHLRETAEGVQIVVPYMPARIADSDFENAMKELVDELLYEENLQNYNLCYYSPMALPYTRHLRPDFIIYDKIDDSRLLPDLETELFKIADVVFTAGHSLYEASKHRHHNIHPIPNSIEYSHFAQARQELVDPDTQSGIPHPRIGFHGVIDERFNGQLLAQMALLKPDYHFIVVGPIVRIDSSTLPKADNIHYFDKKDYSELPLYLAGWDCAMMPFTLSDSTRYLCPTMTLEFLAAGKPVVSTSIGDVMSGYGETGLIFFADEAEDFINAIEKAIEVSKDPIWTSQVDNFLDGNSWDNTFMKVAALESECAEVTGRHQKNLIPIPIPMLVNNQAHEAV